MRILIAGRAGFIGSAVSYAFIRDSADRILVLDKLTYAGNLASTRPVAVAADRAILSAKDRTWPRLRDLSNVFP